MGVHSKRGSSGPVDKAGRNLFAAALIGISGVGVSQFIAVPKASAIGADLDGYTKQQWSEAPFLLKVGSTVPTDRGPKVARGTAFFVPGTDPAKRSDMVATSAHVVTDHKGRALKPEDVKMRYLDEFGKVRVAEVEAIYLNPKYAPGAHEYDAAIVKLKHPVGTTYLLTPGDSGVNAPKEIGSARAYGWQKLGKKTELLADSGILELTPKRWTGHIAPWIAGSGPLSTNRTGKTVNSGVTAVSEEPRLFSAGPKSTREFSGFWEDRLPNARFSPGDPIFAGDSGGPLVALDSRGRPVAVGINTAGAKGQHFVWAKTESALQGAIRAAAEAGVNRVDAGADVQRNAGGARPWTAPPGVFGESQLASGGSGQQPVEARVPEGRVGAPSGSVAQDRLLVPDRPSVGSLNSSAPPLPPEPRSLVPDRPSVGSAGSSVASQGSSGGPSAEVFRPSSEAEGRGLGSAAPPGDGLRPQSQALHAVPESFHAPAASAGGGFSARGLLRTAGRGVLSLGKMSIRPDIFMLGEGGYELGKDSVQQWKAVKNFPGPEEIIRQRDEAWVRYNRERGKQLVQAHHRQFEEMKEKIRDSAKGDDARRLIESAGNELDKVYADEAARQLSREDAVKWNEDYKKGVTEAAERFLERTKQAYTLNPFKAGGAVIANSAEAIALDRMNQANLAALGTNPPKPYAAPDPKQTAAILQSSRYERQYKDDEPFLPLYGLPPISPSGNAGQALGANFVGEKEEADQRLREISEFRRVDQYLTRNAPSLPQGHTPSPGGKFEPVVDSNDLAHAPFTPSAKTMVYRSPSGGGSMYVNVKNSGNGAITMTKSDGSALTPQEAAEARAGFKGRLTAMEDAELARQAGQKSWATAGGWRPRDGAGEPGQQARHEDDRMDHGRASGSSPDETQPGSAPLKSLQPAATPSSTNLSQSPGGQVGLAPLRTSGALGRQQVSQQDHGQVGVAPLFSGGQLKLAPLSGSRVKKEAGFGDSGTDESPAADVSVGVGSSVETTPQAVTGPEDAEGAGSSSGTRVRRASEFGEAAVEPQAPQPQPHDSKWDATLNKGLEAISAIVENNGRGQNHGGNGDFGVGGGAQVGSVQSRQADAPAGQGASASPQQQSQQGILPSPAVPPAAFVPAASVSSGSSSGAAAAGSVAGAGGADGVSGGWVDTLARGAQAISDVVNGVSSAPQQQVQPQEQSPAAVLAPAASVQQPVGDLGQPQVQPQEQSPGAAPAPSVAAAAAPVDSSLPQQQYSQQPVG